jgi:Gametolysin peptidase M11/Fibronectin type III domain
MRTLTALGALLVALTVVPSALAHGGHSHADGTMLTWHGDTFGPGVAFGQGVDTGVAGLQQVEMNHGQAAKLAGKRVSVTGERRGSVLVAAAGGATQTGASVVAAATGSRRVAVLLMNFTNDSSQPWTAATVRSVVFDGSTSVAAYYQDASYGQFGFTGDVYGWFTIPDDDAGCDYTGWGSKARTAATAAGVDLAAYDHVVYAFPSASSCGWSGLAYLPGRDSWINGAMTLRVVSHELGHNFGVHHASTLSCTSGGVRVTLGGTCTASEYGDPFTVMGAASTYHHNNWHRAQLGWVGMQTVTASGTYALAPAELSSGTRVLRVARGDGSFFHLEFRQPTQPFETFSAASPVASGVSIRQAPELSSRVQSRLLDATPATTSFTDAALASGASFFDALSGVRISTVSVSPAGASVSIELGGVPPPPPDTTPPSAPASLAATPQGPTSVALAWTAATDDVGVTGYRVYRGGTQIGSTTGLSYTDSGLTPSTTYAYEVRAVDAATNLGPPRAASATTPAQTDVTPPSAPALTATVVKGRRVELSWTASSDASGIAAYRVLRNGVQIAQTTARSLSDRPGRGTFTYVVRAVDGAGNTADSNARQVST